MLETPSQAGWGTNKIAVTSLEKPVASLEEMLGYSGHFSVKEMNALLPNDRESLVGVDLVRF